MRDSYNPVGCENEKDKCVKCTVVCLEGLGLDNLAALAAHDQVEVVLCGTLAKYWHVCVRRRNNETVHKQLIIR